MTLIAPKIESFANIKDFFRALVAVNASENPKFSHRNFARRLGWPVSLMADVVADRRTLSVARALQLAVSLKLTADAADQLVDLCLVSSRNREVRSNFEQRIARESRNGQGARGGHSN